MVSLLTSRFMFTKLIFEVVYASMKLYCKILLVCMNIYLKNIEYLLIIRVYCKLWNFIVIL